MKHLLYEDNGEFRAATVMSEAGSSLQVELASGKRAKVKASHVVLRFDSPSPEALMPAARELADQIDVEFLWECAPQDEFAFTDLAGDYFGADPDAQQATALLLKLHASPVHFHRKGRGRYRPAPPETLRAALAALERKREQEARIEADAQAMIDGRLPSEVAAQAAWLLVRPDKMSLTWKAFDRALAATGKTPERLLLELGAFASPRELHLARFAAEHFPHGFGIALSSDPLDGFRSAVEQLPLADIDTFSIDDSTTTEIDDSLSVRRIEGGWRIGVHIAAPGLAIPPGSEIDMLARERMSTVYMPGGKITMLPEPLIAACSLDEGREMPALSLYVDTDESGEVIVGQYSQAERVRVVANLRHDLLDGVYTEESLSEAGGAAAVAAAAADALPRFAEELSVLWKLTLALSAARERVRGKPEPRFRADFSFYLDPAPEGEEPLVRIVPRRRDSVLDRIVAEMAFLANSEWGRLLGDHDTPGIYRSQQNGRVRVTSQPLPHMGLGVAQYMWTTSPLRRYVDLVNQRQVLAVLAGERAPFAHNDAELFSLMSAFDAKYVAYGDFQQRMERYWCLRWVVQQGLRRAEAVVVREDLVRLVDAPLYFRLAGLPLFAPGRRILVDILGTDELDLSVEARFVEAAAAGLVEVDEQEAEGPGR
ncbi:MAG TPA: RNB domain-containing ribonuclease [Burkholderiaceae bacterium]|nr:RNB domain-containing ribonuclease [Burkholderiaceae bacterium]